MNVCAPALWPLTKPFTSMTPSQVRIAAFDARGFDNAICVGQAGDFNRDGLSKIGWARRRVVERRGRHNANRLAQHYEFTGGRVVARNRPFHDIIEFNAVSGSVAIVIDGALDQHDLPDGKIVLRCRQTVFRESVASVVS